MENDQAAGTAIELADLTKDYGRVRAVQDLTLRVRTGEIYGFLGRNGAGKTTTIRMILGLITPTAGRVSIFGRELRKDRVAALSSMGYLVESATAYPNLTVRENLEIHRRLLGAAPHTVEDVIALQHLEAYRDRRAGRLSLGNKQRLGIARALLGSPRILVLDEPANGLDPAGIVEIRELLLRLSRDKGVTVFLSSHILGEISLLADRIGIIHQGRLVEEIDSGRAARAGFSEIEIAVSDPARAARVLAADLGLSAVAGAGPGSLRVECDQARAADIARAVVGAGVDLTRLCPASEDLEMRFMRLTGASS
jgi:ABC-type multidrug transport system ATPase subunit